MRTAEIVDGVVVNIYGMPRARAVEFYSGAGRRTFVELQDDVDIQVGYTYNSKAGFENPLAKPTPPPAEVSLVDLQNRLYSEVRALRDRKASEYFTQWDNYTVTNLWPLFLKEIEAYESGTIPDIQKAVAIRGFTAKQFNTNEPTNAQILHVVAGLQNNIKLHAQKSWELTSIFDTLTRAIETLNSVNDAEQYDVDAAWAAEEAK